ncbi:cation:proton antiporter [Niveispirillum sp.]|uniref:cation:proton antiporter domain-containing protein n=1 Tax=Niveispirillum sp. TaxID=1917217 RepID=UPI001B7ADC2B|nr:cation:proton antiporter [Niveispirillum sp.]MBP7337208.1 cation:proton antiporter [Niveispirillum sp.]
MPHDTNLLATLSIAFVLAFGFGFLADRLRLPPLVGYLVAGVLVGPFTPGFVADGKLALELAEIGVILLMFGVGLHFSAADLMAVKGVAIPGAVGQIIIATLMGLGLALYWDWGLGAGIVLGLSLSVASTVVLLKALEERNLLHTPNGRIAVGWLIVEDLAMVVALVLLPAFAGLLGGTVPADGGGHGAPAPTDAPVLLTLAITLGKVGLFAAVALLLGPRIVPWLLAQVARTGSRELFTLAVLAIAMGIAYGSAQVFGVSFALGAFFAGVVLAESRFSHKAAADSLPLQDAFSVIFFVSVGMLFDPSILLREPLAVAAVLLTIIVGKSLVAFAIVLALGYPMGAGLLVSASLAQIGEFSFILVGLGVSMNLLPPEGRDLVLAGALLSITLNPLVFTAVEKLTGKVKARHPEWSSYGQPKFKRLTQQINRVRDKMADREKAHGLQVQKLVETFPVLSHLDKHELERLLLMFRPAAAVPGERVIRSGDPADGMYFIASGAVEVQLPGHKIKLETGAFFGEMALLSGRRRSADITALDYCQFLILERRDFNQFTRQHGELRGAILEMANQRRKMNQAAKEKDEKEAAA